MEFFCYHRDRAGSGELRDELLAAHWSYMDGFAGTFPADGPGVTGIWCSASARARPPTSNRRPVPS